MDNDKPRDRYGVVLGPNALAQQEVIRKALAAYEDLGYEDPEGTCRDWFEEQMEDVLAASRNEPEAGDDPAEWAYDRTQDIRE